ncbi:MAG: Omp28-related outer membrane protein, partial [Bacteroidetes bacterium]|nr:Omp28-related outer membrane protein [Bacteroidota bacterium]
SIPKFFANDEAFGVYTPLSANVDYATQKVEEFEAKEVVAGLYGEYKISEDKKVDATVYTKFFSDIDGTYKIGVYVMENGIVNYQNGIGQDHVHDHLVRSAVSGILGTSLPKTQFATNEVIKTDYDKVVSDVVDVNNTYVVAILFKSLGATSLEIVNSRALELFEE